MKRLPMMRIEGKMYFLDRRLRQLRNVDNPHDYIDIDRADPDDARVKQASKYFDLM